VINAMQFKVAWHFFICRRTVLERVQGLIRGGSGDTKSNQELTSYY